MRAARWAVVLLLVLAVIPFTAKPVKAVDPWASAYASWQYRTTVTIDYTAGTVDLTDFQVKVVLDSTWPGWAHVNSDGSDIRFALADGTTIPYDLTHTGVWDYTNHYAEIWIKVPSIPAGGSTTVYLYYGNPSATDASDPNVVFEFFDDFDGTALDTNKWTAVTGTWAVQNGELYVSSSYGQYPGNIIRSSYQLSSDVVVEMKATIPEVSSGNTDVSLATCPSSGYVGTEIIGPVNLGPSTSSYYAWGQAGSSAWTWETGSDSNVQMGQTYTYQMNYVSGTATLKILETGTSYSHALTSNYLGIHIGATIGTGFGVDWIRVRKYAGVEPTVTVSTTEEVNSGGYTVTLSLKDDAGNSLSGVTIYVDGNLVGTYNDGDSITISTEGTHTIRGEKAGYVPAETSVDIVAGTTSYTASLTLTEIPQPTITVNPTSPKLGETISITLSAPAKTGFTWTYKYQILDSSGNALVSWTSTSDGTASYTIPTDTSYAHSTITIKAITVDSASGAESLESSLSVAVANSPPSAPTLSVSPGTVATAGDTITATASGSTDPDGDSITYEYKFEDVTAGTILQDWSTTNSYTTTLDQAGHVIRVWARAYDGIDYSSEVYVDVNLDNHPPTPPTSLVVTPGFHVGKTSTFTASGSTDEDGDSITYEYRIVDSTTGAVIRDWSSTNTFTPSSSQLYHTITIYARAVDSKGAASDAVSRVYFVLPGETIADVPFDPDLVKSKVIFTLSSAWTDVTGLMVKTDGQNGTFLLASFNGVHWWLNLTGDKAILYSDSPFGPLLVPELKDTTIGSSMWAWDYVQKFVEFAQQAGTLEGTAISPGTTISTYTAYVAGINKEGVMWAAWLRYSYTGSWSGKYINWYLTPPNGAADVYTVAYEYYQTTNSDVTDFVLDFYDEGQTAGAQPEVSWSDAGGVHSGLNTFSLASFTLWLTNRTFHFYLHAANGFENYLIGGARIVGISTDPALNITSGTVSVSGPTYYKDVIKINVQPLPVPTKVTFWFYDENNNPLNGVDVYLGSTFIGTFNSGESYTLDYAGTYTFTAKKLHYVDTTVTTYVEGNAGVSFTLPLQSYNVTVKIEDEHGNLINATLYIDGQSYGTVDETTVSLKYGSHTFRAVDAQGYSGETTAIVDHDGQVVVVQITHPVLVTFLIYDASNLTNLSQLTPMSAVTLYIDGAAHVINSGDSLEILPGTHEFIFVKEGYLNVTLRAEIKSETTITVYMFKGVAVGFDAPSMTIDITDEGIDSLMGLFGHWPGGEFLKDLFRLDLKGFLTDLFGMRTTAGGRPATWVGTFLALIVWLQGVMAVWFYHKNPITTLAFGRLLYDGLSQFVAFNPAVLAGPVAAFSLYMGYLVLKNIAAKWSGEE